MTEINFRYIRYREGSEFIDLQRDPAGESGEPAVVYVPSPKPWYSEMPPWAHRRRDDILRRIQSSCSHIDHKWEEY